MRYDYSDDIMITRGRCIERTIVTCYYPSIAENYRRIEKNVHLRLYQRIQKSEKENVDLTVGSYDEKETIAVIINIIVQGTWA